MPAFYPQAMAGQITPPYTGSYDMQSGHPSQYHHDSYAPSQGMPPRLDSAMDYAHRYPPPPPMQQTSYNRQSFGSQQSLPPISGYYETMGAPILPPLRMQDAAYVDHDYYQQYAQGMPSQVDEPQQAALKEEQPTGGVSAKLDYEMESMTDFVCEAAQGMYALHSSNICLADIDICRSIQPGTSVHPSFRKWVFQVLSATRLPSATILLSLHYLTVRLRDFPSSIEKTENQLYRLLAVSMILGSKFLDDNTFINRSWSDVSGIKVSELNTLEIKWLALIRFNLHADPSDANGVSLWTRVWKEYVARTASQVKAVKLSPLNTALGQQKLDRSSFQSGVAKTAQGTFTPLSTGSGDSTSSASYMSADPWNRTDHSQVDFFAMQGRFQPMEDMHYLGRYDSHSHGRAAQYSQYALPPLHSLAPSFYNPWNQHNWQPHHGYGCHCVGCSHQTSPSYMMGSHFTPQTVVG